MGGTQDRTRDRAIVVGQARGDVDRDDGPRLDGGEPVEELHGFRECARERAVGTGAHDAVDTGVREEHFGPCGRVLDGAQRLSAEVNDAHDRGRNLARDVEHVAVQISLGNRLINALFSSSRAWAKDRAAPSIVNMRHILSHRARPGCPLAQRRHSAHGCSPGLVPNEERGPGEYRGRHRRRAPSGEVAPSRHLGNIEGLGDARQDRAHNDEGDADDGPAQLLARARLVEPQDAQRCGDQDAQLREGETRARAQLVGVELEQQDGGAPQDAVEDRGDHAAVSQRVLGVDAATALDREEDRAVDGVANRLGQEELGGLNLKELDDEREGDEAQRRGRQQEGAALPVKGGRVGAGLGARQEPDADDEDGDGGEAVGQRTTVEPLAEDRDARQGHEDQLSAGGQGHRATHAQDRVGAQLIAHADAEEQAGQEGDAQVQRRPRGVQEGGGDGGHEQAAEDGAHDSLAV